MRASHALDPGSNPGGSAQGKAQGRGGRAHRQCKLLKLGCLEKSRAGRSTVDRDARKHCLRALSEFVEAAGSSPARSIAQGHRLLEPILGIRRMGFDIYALIEVTWLLIPALAANGLAPLARGRRPVDGGRLWGGKPILGKGKTWEGTVLGVVAASLVGGVMAFMRPGVPFEA